MSSCGTVVRTTCTPDGGSAYATISPCFTKRPCMPSAVHRQHTIGNGDRGEALHPIRITRQLGTRLFEFHLVTAASTRSVKRCARASLQLGDAGTQRIDTCLQFRSSLAISRWPVCTSCLARPAGCE